MQLLLQTVVRFEILLTKLQYSPDIVHVAEECGIFDLIDQLQAA